jgi:predicted ATPase
MVQCLTNGKSLPREIADQIIERTDGVPLFVEELTKAVVESGVLEEAGDRYTLSHPLPPLAIPTTLQGSLLARLDRLASVRDVAQLGAALGRHFSYELISAVAAMPHEPLQDALSQLEAAELIYRNGTPPDAEYTFKHALVQDAAYSTLLRARRIELHARIAAALENRFPAIVAAEPQLVAHHCAEAGLVVKAIEYRLRAGQKAITRSAMTEAEAQLRKGLALLASVPGDLQRERLELEIQIALARALIATQGYAAPAVAETQARARELWNLLGQPPQAATAHLSLANQFEYRLTRAELTEARNEARDVLDRGSAGNDVLWQIAGCNMSAAASFFLGEFAESSAYSERALDLCGPEDHGPDGKRSVGSIYRRTVALSYRFLSSFCLGYPDRARAGCEEAKAAARDHTFSLALALTAGLYVDNDPAMLLRRCEELEAHCIEHHFPTFAAQAVTLRGAALMGLGQLSRGLLFLVDGLAAYRATGAALQVPTFLAELANAYREVGRPGEGVKHLDEAARQIERTRERWAEAHILRVRAEVLLALGDNVAAEHYCRQAIDVARRQNAKLWELRAATSLARLWRNGGRRSEAHSLLAPIYAWFTEGFDTPDLREARKMLEELA